MFGFIRHFFRLQFVLIVFAIFAGIYYPWSSREENNESPATHPLDNQAPHKGGLFTKAELRQYTGENGTPIYLALLGNVYDVTKGVKHYGPGCSYNFFVGRDASVSFITGEFDLENFVEAEADDVVKLKPKDLISLDNWKRFYDKDYTYMGKLVGRFYDNAGEPTAYYYEYAALLEQAQLSKAEAEQLREKYPDCNIEWSAETGTHVWCTTSSGGKERVWVGYPRKLYEVGNDSFRCACINEKDLDSTDIMTKEYENCERLSHECYYQV